MASRLDAALDALFAFLMRPRVRRWRQWSFLVTVPVAYLVFRLRGVEAGLGLIAVEFAIGISVLFLLLRKPGERRDAGLDLLAHPLARRVTLTELEVITTGPRALLRPLFRPKTERRFGYGGRSHELASPTFRRASQGHLNCGCRRPSGGFRVRDTA